MAQQILNRGISPGDGSGDTGYVGAGKINDNFAEIYTAANVNFSVTAYGAKCDGVTDDTAAVNNAIAAALAFYNAASFNNPKITFPAKSACIVSGTINFTGFTNIFNTLTVEGNGTVLYSSVAGAACLDAMGSQNVIWRNLTVRGVSGSATNGIQIGRLNATIPAGLMTFTNVTSIGVYSLAACYVYASEENQWDHCIFRNSSITGGFGLVMDGLQHWNVATIAPGGQTVAQDTPTSFLQNTFIQGRFMSTAGPLGAGIWVANAQQMHFENSYGYCAPTAGPAFGSAVWIYTTASNANDFSSKDNRFNLHCEPTIANIFFITGPGSGAQFTATPTIRGLVYQDSYIFASTDVFALDPAANLTTVTLQNTNVEISGGPAAPTFGAFDQPAKYAFTGRFVCYAASRFNGTVYTGDYYVEEAGVGRSYINGETGGLSLLSGSTIGLASTGLLQWSTRGKIGSPTANDIQIGPADSGTNNDQTVRAQGAVSGNNNQTGGALNLVAGLGTGSSVPAFINLKTGHVLGSGTTKQTETTQVSIFDGGMIITPVTVANLPAAAAANKGGRTFVTDANATTFASIVAGGGANGVPVYSDGTNWRIG